ncbi:TonB-dependent receptor [Limibacter armeniacum]|uniref:TonB-dependent receptor n=1 Tax=Limibacter armeniacum TaxID=466084 RepID=UPI002FE6A671
MKAKAIIVSLILFVLISPARSQDIQQLNLNGFVKDKATKEPLMYVTVSVGKYAYAITDKQGYFQAIVNQQTNSELVVKFSLVGKRPVERKITLLEGESELQLDDILMEDLDLYMEEVTVVAERDEANISNTAYKIDRTAVEQSRANSLSELLMQMPGQTVQNPLLQGAQTITFRSSNSNDQDALNNAFGIGIFLNGNPLNNNADMQGINPTQRGFFDSFKNTSTPGSESYTPGDSPGGGFDLRQLPVGNIDKVEIVQGVASAEYGDITEGAIIIETIAGKSPLSFTYRQGGGNSNYFVNKGFQLNQNNAVSVGLDYLNSNPDPNDRMKSYNRINGNLLWTTFIGQNKRIRNNFNLNYNTTLDDFKSDPDLKDNLKVRYQRKSFSASNQLNVNLPWQLFDGFRLSANFSTGESISETEEWINTGVRPIITYTEEGIHEGTYSSGTYMGYMKVHGKPVTAGTRLNFSKAFQTGSFSHNLNYGYQYNFSANFGEGRIFDPLKPLNNSSSPTSDRPYSFKDSQPSLHQHGLYLEDKIKGEIAGKDLSLSLGLRSDYQFGYESISPRINARYQLFDKVAITGAYGIQTKAPGLIHLYPGPSYEDIVLLNSYTGNLKESIYLAYTHVEDNDAEGLQPMSSRRHEIGFNYKSRGINLTATYFNNITDNGFYINSVAEIIEVPEYEITARPEGQSPIYQPTGNYIKRVVNNNTIDNSKYTKNRGVEVVGSVPKVESINTSFNFWATYYHTVDRGREEYATKLTSNAFVEAGYAYAIYPYQYKESGELKASLGINYHLAPLGLLASVRVESFIYKYTYSDRSSVRAYGFIDQDYNKVYLSEEEIDAEQYDILQQSESGIGYLRKPPVVYFNSHLNLSKNIGKHIRFTFFANNFLNIRPEGEQEDLYGNVTSFTLNQKPYFGLELSAKF